MSHDNLTIKKFKYKEACFLIHALSSQSFIGLNSNKADSKYLVSCVAILNRPNVFDVRVGGMSPATRRNMTQHCIIAYALSPVTYVWDAVRVPDYSWHGNRAWCRVLSQQVSESRVSCTDTRKHAVVLLGDTSWRWRPARRAKTSTRLLADNLSLLWPGKLPRLLENSARQFSEMRTRLSYNYRRSRNRAVRDDIKTSNDVVYLPSLHQQQPFPSSNSMYWMRRLNVSELLSITLSTDNFAKIAALRPGWRGVRPTRRFKTY